MHARKGHHGHYSAPAEEGGEGIAKLLAAETAAAKIVAEARKARPRLGQSSPDRQERVKQAKAEAHREIAAYKAEREGAYQKMLSDATSGAAETAQRLQADSGRAIAQVEAEVDAARADVVALLVRYATTV
ncbi:transmembrane ATPase [Raphidocelis subcapitata]|uniref:Transmembrane ATPase n=1 Tax=Raphidocelis subcapitata TaxID=307507 RepID=A0A2V0PJR8_9CHLO|nr:transmembrane ATPase [Raphidocelis subcapitata]|eukprot:GBF98233.1 transmembrane ATPase [Raphidocelis subcapitata]